MTQAVAVAELMAGPADFTDEQVAMFREIDALSGYERHNALIMWARHPNFTSLHLIPPMIDLCDGPVSNWQLAVRISREAYAALKIEMQEETPGKAWADALRPSDRSVICRHLQIDPAEPLAHFATLPFRIIRSESEKPWIAAAIGCERFFDHLLKAHAPSGNAYWRHIDIQDVILWNPRSGEVKLAGHHGPTLVECPDYENGRYTVFSDPRAFFRAWADRRAEFDAIVWAAAKAKRVIPREPMGNLMPGALAIGDLNAIHWRDLNASVLVAGPGTDPDALKRAIYRSANLPRVEAPISIARAA